MKRQKIKTEDETISSSYIDNPDIIRGIREDVVEISNLMVTFEIPEKN
jgi:hypothetical protein